MASLRFCRFSNHPQKKFSSSPEDIVVDDADPQLLRLQPAFRQRALAFCGGGAGEKGVKSLSGLWAGEVVGEEFGGASWRRGPHHERTYKYDGGQTETNNTEGE